MTEIEAAKEVTEIEAAKRIFWGGSLLLLYFHMKTPSECFPHCLWIKSSVSLNTL